jgi:excisionase family DNA binding protein
MSINEKPITGGTSEPSENRQTVILAEILGLLKQNALTTKQFLNIEETSEVTGIKQSTLYKLTSQGRIPCAKVGKRLVFLKDDLHRWLSQQVQLKSGIV